MFLVTFQSGVQDMANGALLQDAESMGSGEVFFLPQRPYMVLGTLRQQLLYPRWSEEEVGVDTSTGKLQRLLDVEHRSATLNRPTYMIPH